MLSAVDQLTDDGLYTASIELAFGATERSIEAFAMAEGGDELSDFHDHTTCYDRASAIGLLSEATTDGLRALYASNRTDSYYGGKRPTKQQADAMKTLCRSIHTYVTNQIQEGGVCVCESDG